MPPNIVLIMTDQQRADFSQADGFPLDTTPFLDELGRRGARFRRAYTPAPLCTPARVSTFTGRFPSANHVLTNDPRTTLFAPTDLTRLLREHGYSVNLAGKDETHYQSRDDYDFYRRYLHGGAFDPKATEPQDVAMDEWFRHGGGAMGISLEPTPLPVEAQPPYRVVRDAIECLETRDERPFFLWLSFAEPHNPYQVSEPYFSMFPEDEVPDRLAGPEAIDGKGPKWRWFRDLLEGRCPGYDQHHRRYRANYCGMLRLIDDQIRRFVNYLEEAGLMQETILIFISDHGDYAADYGLLRKGVEMPECLIRIPMIWAGPGIVAGEGQRDEFVSIVDIMPTLCEAIGADIPVGVQGRSLWPMLTGSDFPAEEFRSIYAEQGFGGLHYTESERRPPDGRYRPGGFDELNPTTQSGAMRMVRMGKWKLEFNMLGRSRLYDVEADPAELYDLFGEPSLREVRLEMAEEMLQWTLRVQDEFPGKYEPKHADHNWYAPHREAGGEREDA